MLPLDVEVCDEEEADETIAAGVNVIMLDNIEGNKLVSAARCLCERWKGEEGRKKLLLDTSGDKPKLTRASVLSLVSGPKYAT